MLPFHEKAPSGGRKVPFARRWEETGNGRSRSPAGMTTKEANGKTRNNKGAWVEGLLLAEDVAHAADLGADAAELLFETLVAAVHVVDAVEDGLAVGDQRGQDEGG